MAASRRQAIITQQKLSLIFLFLCCTLSLVQYSQAFHHHHHWGVSSIRQRRSRTTTLIGRCSSYYHDRDRHQRLLLSHLAASRQQQQEQESVISDDGEETLEKHHDHNEHAAATHKNDTAFADLDITPLAFGSIPDAMPLPHHHHHLSDSSGVLVQQQEGTLVVEEEEYEEDDELPLIQLALAGSIASWIADVSMHPIDCIKTVQQSDSGIGLTFVQAIMQLWHTGGILAFYQGFLTYANADAVGGALKFSVWELWKNNPRVKELFTPVPWLQLWCGAALAFVASSVLIVPGELIKQQLQMGHYDNLYETVSAIHASTDDGISAFFLGYEGVLYRDVPYTMLELGLYEVFKTFLMTNNEDEEDVNSDTTSASSGPWKEVLAAAVTGGITAICTTPLDVVKTKLMVDDQYANLRFLECMMLSVQAHGWPSLFAGVLARVAWIVPFTAIYLPTYDALKRFFWERYEAETYRTKET